MQNMEIKCICSEGERIFMNKDGVDKLTGLYVGKILNRKLEEYIDENRENVMAVYVMDIDNFKVVDDNLGRVFGNEIIKETAEAVSHLFEKEDIVGRVGGDKFVVCQKDCGGQEDVKKKAGEICSKVRNVYTGEKQDYIVSMSIGIALYPEHGNCAAELLENADKALEYTKEYGKDGFSIFMPCMHEKIAGGRVLEENGQLSGELECSEGVGARFDCFGYELLDLAFELIEDTKNIGNAINLLLRKVGVHYDMDVIAVRGLINKPRTLRYLHEYVKDHQIPVRRDSEWQYTEDDWDTFLSHFDNGYYLYYESEGKKFDISEIQNDNFVFRTFCEIPIIGNGQILGCVDYIFIRREVHLKENDLNTLRMFTKVIASYILNMQKHMDAVQKMGDLNDHDALTGLMKYEVFFKKFKKAIQRWKKGSFIVIVYSDLKHFKYINETYGYDVGNKLLRKFCNKTIRDVQGMIGAARVYSDNIVFAAEFPDRYSDEEIYQRILEKNHKLNQELQETFMDNNINICTGIFIVKNPNVDLEIAISNANMARKEAKKKERNTVVLFDDEMMQSVVRQMQLNAELPGAIKNREIKVYYQPKIESGTGKIVGGEALVRWQKENGKFIYPDEFIPGFEENGMIVEVDYYVYECVFQKIKERLERHQAVVPISMNISSVHLKEDELLDYVKYLFEKYQVPAEYIEFELTESIYIENLERALKLIHEFQKMGIRISMDDFGSGYSSLNLLNNLPIDILKVDKIFLHGNALTVNQKIIISSIIEMASKLNIRVVCEGVETSEQANFLTVIGCDMIQGYYYARPMPEDDFYRYVDEHIKVKAKVVSFPLDGNFSDTSGQLSGYYIGNHPRFGDGPFEGTTALQCIGGKILSDMVSLPVESFTNSSYTVTCWAKVRKEGMWSSVVSMEFENGFNSIMPNAGDLKADFRVKTDGEGTDVWHDTGSEVMPDEEWHFYAATYNAQTKVGILFVDNVIAGYMENVPVLSGVSRILVGGDIYAAPFDGLIAQINIFNQSLSKIDIEEVYQQEEKRLSAEVRNGRRAKDKIYMR